MTASRCRLARTLAAVGSTLSSRRLASARDAYPHKPLRFIVPFADGPDTGDRLRALGLDVNFGGPGEVARAIAADTALWGPLIKSLGVHVE